MIQRPTLMRRLSAEESMETTKIIRITENDCNYMQQAVEAAENGIGNTYPKPAVGCIIVAHEEKGDKIIGRGFHPKAGYPHAEVFALLEACGHVSDGLESALEIVMNIKNSNIRKMNASKTSIVKSCRILRDCVRCIHLKMEQCARIVSSFVKRISPRPEDEIAELDYDISMNGAKFSALRKLARRMKGA